MKEAHPSRPILSPLLPIMALSPTEDSAMTRRRRTALPSFLLSSGSNLLSNGSEPLVRLWMLRALIHLKGHRQFLNARGFNDDDVARALGLQDELDAIEFDDDHRFSRQAMLSTLKHLHQEAEKQAAGMKAPANLHLNVQRLARLTGMTEADCRLLEFAILMNNDEALRSTMDMLGQLSSTQARQVLSTLLNLPLSAIRQGLSSDGILSRAGLLVLEPNGSSHLRAKLNLISDAFADKALSEEQEPADLLSGMVQPAPAPKLTLADYQHARRDTAIAEALLRDALTTGRTGCNILLYGPPGTGKTELVRALAQTIGCELFEVTCEDESDEPAVGHERLRSFQSAQYFFAQHRALILFDEVEDVFNDGNAFFGHPSTAQRSKGRTNQILESNPLPAFWLSNDIRRMDAAFVRRFDLVMELPIPPRFQRERMVQQACADLPLEAERLHRISQHEALSPAIMERAASVACRMEAPTSERPAIFERLVSNTLQAQGHAPIPRHTADALPGHYDPAFIHARDGDTSIDLARMAGDIIRHGQARLCLYGPPGTGKTAYGRWLAEQAKRPLLVKRGSDLISMWVGETEKNIVRAFREAEQDNAVLLIDEVDSFLQDRRQAQRSWEITAVNEMLTQMESHPGIFIASTNLMSGLDQAALRRFDLKARFDYLKPEQAWALLEKQCLALGLAVPDTALRSMLDQLPVLTPGDFAAVARRHRFHPMRNAEELMAALKAECALKEDAPKRGIGFV